LQLDKDLIKTICAASSEEVERILETVNADEGKRACFLLQNLSHGTTLQDKTTLKTAFGVEAAELMKWKSLVHDLILLSGYLADQKDAFTVLSELLRESCEVFLATSNNNYVLCASLQNWLRNLFEKSQNQVLMLEINNFIAKMELTLQFNKCAQ
jgi:hypothetical protein